MKRLNSELLEYYDSSAVLLISEKYGLSSIDALKEFILSKTHKMLENADLEMWEFGPKAIFEIWECEKSTGDPRNSVYIREE